MKSVTHVLWYVCLGGGGGDLFYFIIIKMASVFNLPDVNVYMCVCVGGGGVMG